jgi:hypothetical protein
MVLENAPHYKDERGLDAVWCVAPGSTGAPKQLYAGIEPAGLFVSSDYGNEWQPLRGLNDHPTASTWSPAGGPLALHSIAVHAHAPERIVCAISAGGCYRSDDAGESWRPINRNVRAEFLPQQFPESGQCVHKLLADPTDPSRLVQQNHCGVYRSDDGGTTWTEITNNLPNDFGFPMGVHPRNPETMWVIPLTSPEAGRHMIDGHAAVWRSRDRGDSWEQVDSGLPAQNAYLTVLREAMGVDRLEPAGVYFGNSTGQLFGSADEGDSWQLLADYLPDIWSVEAAVVES